MRQNFKVFLIILSIAILIGCKLKSNNKWEVLKTFKSLENIAELKDFNSVQIGFLNDKVGFAIYRGNHVFYSNDSGEKWAETVVDTQPCLSGIDIFDENNIIVGCQCSPVEYSKDKGKTWNKIDESNYSVFGLYNNNSGIVAQIGGNKNIKLLENFKSVKDIKLPEGIKNNSAAAISCISNNESYILLSGLGPLLKTKNSGETWEQINLQNIKDKLIFEPGVTSMRFTDINNGIIIGYYYKKNAWISLTTKDGGKSWKYAELLKITNQGNQSYLSRDSNFLTIVNANDKEYPIVLLKRKI